MTDNEIIKALECCTIKHDCNECPYKVEKCNLLNSVLSDALDLINRLQAEIDNFKMVLDAVEDHINPLPFETDYAKAIKQAKSEAIKEFAEKVKKSTTRAIVGGDILTIIDKDLIDNLVNEMVGEE